MTGHIDPSRAARTTIGFGRQQNGNQNLLRCGHEPDSAVNCVAGNGEDMQPFLGGRCVRPDDAAGGFLTLLGGGVLALRKQTIASTK